MINVQNTIYIFLSELKETWQSLTMYTPVKVLHLQATVNIATETI